MLRMFKKLLYSPLVMSALLVSTAMMSKKVGIQCYFFFYQPKPPTGII